MTKEKQHKRFHIRDIETKKINESFNSETSAINWIQSLAFGLGNYYEVYDSKNFEVSYKLIGKKKKINRHSI